MALKNQSDFTLAAVSAACGEFTVIVDFQGRFFHSNRLDTPWLCSAAVATSQPHRGDSGWTKRWTQHALLDVCSCGFALSCKVKVTHGG